MLGAARYFRLGNRKYFNLLSGSDYPTSHSASPRSQRDETIQILERDVLLPHQARESQATQLDIQEQESLSRCLNCRRAAWLSGGAESHAAEPDSAGPGAPQSGVDRQVAAWGADGLQRAQPSSVTRCQENGTQDLLRPPLLGQTPCGLAHRETQVMSVAPKSTMEKVH
ncbi:hypothetical protein EYF80_002293 [Liparis tanakae]|uniref:Uncharacterized protein n=1 Tax=Liparis tanakae TaxID=230148 RepID=A0A4Z2JBK0_9TELE|nr:hypothetical protein EYF80_002293 [Liparis tanakae]